MTKRIWGWSADRGGCAAYRLKFPFMEIRNRQTAITGLGTTIPPEARELADVIVGQRVVNDGPSRLWQHWAKEGKKRLVYELDDDLWHIEPTNEVAYHFFRRHNIQENLTRNAQVADTVTVSTEPLADVVRKITGHQDVRVVPNAVPPWLLDYQPEKNHLIGWGGSPTHHGDFGQLSRHLGRFMRNNPDTTFHVIGTDYASWMGLPKDQCAFTKWIPSTEDFFKAIDYKMGVAPLAPCVFNRSKSDIKFLELAALGIPSIVSNVRAYETVRHGETGLVAKYEHEWGRKIRELATDEDMRRELGQNAYAYAHTRTTEHLAPVWESALLDF